MEKALVKDTFRRDGVVVVSGFYSAGLIGGLLNDFRNYSSWDSARPNDVVYDEPTHVDAHPVKYVQFANFYVPSLSRLITTRMMGLVSSLFDQDMAFDQMEVHNKAPHGGTRTPHHQDNFYFCYDPPDACTVYVPLETHRKENGGLCFIRGSHLGETLQHERSKVKAFSSFLDIRAGQYPPERILETDMQPGDIVIHHGKTIHFTSENNTPMSRLSVSMRVNGEHARVSPALREMYVKNLAYNRGV